METSNFARCASKKNAVSIARGNPKWYKGISYPALFPTWEMIKLKSNIPLYEKLYKEQILDKLNPKDVYEELGEDSILLCWESPGAFCHRRIVAKWLEESLGVIIPERGIK